MAESQPDKERPSQSTTMPESERPGKSVPPLEKEVPNKSNKLDLIQDCRLMLGFALREGKAFTPELLNDIAKLDVLLVRNGIESMSAVSELFAKAPKIPSPVESLPSQLLEPGPVKSITLLLQVHNSLSVLITPATTRSLRATQTERIGFLSRYMDMPAIVQVAIIGAIIFMIGFVLTLPKPGEKTAEPQSTVDGGKSQ